MGPVPVAGDDQRFPVGASAETAKFTILKEKCPNRRGVEMLLEGGFCSIRMYEVDDCLVVGAGKVAWAQAWRARPQAV